MAEFLTKQIAKEYERRASRLPPNGLQDIGERRELRTELQKRCGLLEIEAVNIINGYYADIYIAKYEMLAARDNATRMEGKHEKDERRI